MLGMASYSWLERTCCTPLVCYSKPGRHLIVSFLTLHLLSWASWLAKNDTVQLTRLTCGLRSVVFKDLKYMINMQSHGFTTGINCTWIHVISYTNSIRSSNIKFISLSCIIAITIVFLFPPFHFHFSDFLFEFLRNQHLVLCAICFS